MFKATKNLSKHETGIQDQHTAPVKNSRALYSLKYALTASQQRQFQNHQIRLTRLLFTETRNKKNQFEF